MTNTRPHDARGRFARKTPPAELIGQVDPAPDVATGYPDVGQNNVRMVGGADYADDRASFWAAAVGDAHVPAVYQHLGSAHIGDRLPLTLSAGPSEAAQLQAALAEIRAELATIRAELVDLRLAQRAPETRPYTPRAYRDSVFGPG